MLKRNIAIILVLLVTLFIYFPSLSYHFVGDDYIPLLKIVTSASLRQVFEFYYPSAGGADCYFRPLEWVPYMLGYSLTGLPLPPDPRWQAGHFLFSYHLISLAFHLANVLLVYLIVFFIFKSRIYGALSALVFAVHPVNSEVVCWVTAIGDAAFTFFSLLSLIFFAKFYLSKEKHHSVICYSVSLASFMLALISKEAALCFPFLIILADLFIRRRDAIPEYKKKARSWLGYFIVVALYFVLRKVLLPQAASPFWELIAKSPEKILKFSYYLRDLVFPLDLIFLKDFLYHYSLMPLAIIIVFLAGLSFVYFIVSRFKKFPVLVFSLLWIVIGLILPVLGIFAVARRHLYFPLVGYSIFLVGFSSLLKRKYAMVFLLSLVIILEIWTSLGRNNLYRFSGEVVQRGLCELKKELPEVKSDSVIYLVGLPGTVRNTPAFWATTAEKIKFIYKDKNLPVFCLSTVTFTEREARESEVLFLDDFTFTQSMQTSLEKAIRVVGEDSRMPDSKWLTGAGSGEYQFKILERDGFGQVAKVIFKLNRQYLKGKQVYFIGIKDSKIRVLRKVEP